MDPPLKEKSDPEPGELKKSHLDTARHILEDLEMSFLKFADQVLKRLELKSDLVNDLRNREKMREISSLINASFISLSEKIEEIPCLAKKGLGREEGQAPSLAPQNSSERGLLDLKKLYFSLFESILEEHLKQLDIACSEIGDSQRKGHVRKFSFKDGEFPESRPLRGPHASRKKKSICSVHLNLSPKETWDETVEGSPKSEKMIGSQMTMQKTVPGVIVVQKFLDLLEALIRSNRQGSTVLESDWAELIIAMSDNKQEKIELSLQNLKNLFQLTSRGKKAKEDRALGSPEKEPSFKFAFEAKASENDVAKDSRLPKKGPVVILIPEQFKRDIHLKAGSIIRSFNRYCSYAYVMHEIKHKEGKQGFSVKILSNNSCCGIGFADRRLIRTDIISLYDKPGSYMFYRNSLSIDGKFKNWGLSPVTVGSSVTILIDFENASISVYINNRLKGQEHVDFRGDEKNIKFYPVVEFYSNNQEVEVLETY